MTETLVHPRPATRLGIFERYLTLWVALCIVAGIILGSAIPGPFQSLGRAIAFQNSATSLAR